MNRFVRALVTPVVVVAIYGFLLRSAYRDAVATWKERREG